MRRAGFWLHAAGVALFLAGQFGPWIAHETAALAVTGFELAELVKFFPLVQSGAVRVTRALFLAPLVAAGVLLALLVNQPAGRRTGAAVKSRAFRVLLTAASVLLTVGALPPYEYFLSPDYCLHWILAMGGAAIALATLVAPRLPRCAWGVLVALASVGGLVPAMRQFALLRPLIVALYGRPPGLGWGLAACAAGGMVCLACGILAALDGDIHRQFCRTR